MGVKLCPTISAFPKRKGSGSAGCAKLDEYKLKSCDFDARRASGYDFSMVDQAESNSFDGLSRLFDPLAACFTPEVASRVANLSVDDSVQFRVDQLAEKCNEGQLSPAEASEYEAYVRAMDMLAILQAKASVIAS